MRAVSLIADLAAALGAVMASLAYLLPETGVSGTPGALLAFAGATSVLVALLLLQWSPPTRRIAGLLRVLAVAGALLTAIAAWFLMQWVLVGAMTVAALSLMAGAGRSRGTPA